MLQKLKKRLKEQKGFTLIELLAVIVILGIIAAIAVPAIGNIMDNSRKDAHVANARQMIASSKLVMAANNDLLPGTNPLYITLEYMEQNNFIDTMKHPDGDAYNKGASTAATSASAPAGAYVKITKNADTGKYEYSVKLPASAVGDRGITAETTEATLDRADVTALSS